MLASIAVAKSFGKNNDRKQRYYVCKGKFNKAQSTPEEKCPSRYAPAEQLDEIVWKDVCEVLSHPESITKALKRAHGGGWLPQELKMRQENLRRGRAVLERQLERLTEAYLGEVIPLAEYHRRRKDLEQREEALASQERQLQAQSRQRLELSGVAGSIEDFCRRVRGGLADATFEQKRKLVELLIDRVIVSGEEVEIRYVIPTDPSSEQVHFCHLRSDFLHHPAPRRVAFLSLRIFLLIADAPDIRSIAVAFEYFPSRVLVVTLVQTQMLRSFLRRLGTLRLWGAAQVLRTPHRCPTRADPRPYYEPSVAAARVRLGEALWEEAFAEGLAMSAEEAAEYALSAEGLNPPAPPASEQLSTGAQQPGLTPREKEVAALVAQGLTNRKIAEELFVSQRTVEHQASKILRKLRLTTRTEIAAWATERTLLASEPD